MTESADDLADALLREAGWVRRVAARLVRDGSAADDVAQDAWVQALRQRPDPSTTLRGWLAEVLRRLAHTRARGDARRRDRELADEAREVPAADRLLEKAELLRSIAQMVGELDEPYRSTVLLRYFEGASAAEIARRQGVPAGTVRWRLKEALDQLRARLSREVDCDRARRALAPIAGAGGLMIPALKVAAVAVAVAGGVTAGVMHHRHAVVVAQNGPPAAASQPRDDNAAADPLAAAADAYVHGQYDEAIALARPHAAAGDSKAWRIVGAASCFKQDAAGAGQAWNQLDPGGRKFVEYVCKRNDVTLPDGAPVM
jgi:RNA polymerase sigma-70 factor (ECF subfamily)